jgi:hypothetical protein
MAEGETRRRREKKGNAAAPMIRPNLSSTVAPVASLRFPPRSPRRDRCVVAVPSFLRLRALRVLRGSFPSPLALAALLRFSLPPPSVPFVVHFLPRRARRVVAVPLSPPSVSSVRSVVKSPPRGKEEGAPGRHQPSAPRRPEVLPRLCRLVRAPVPPMVNGRMTWGEHLTSNEGMSSTRPPRPPRLIY